MKKTSVVWICESAVMIALSTVLSLIKVVDMPFGGSVTAASMVPVILVAYRYGFGRGIFVGVVYGLIQLLLSANTLSYATSFGAAVAIILYDYVLAFAALSFGGVFKKTIQNQRTALTFGTLIACAVRYLFHVISGCTVWAGVSIPTSDGLSYSLVYNAAYMIPETIVTAAVVWYFASIIDFGSERLGKAQNIEKQTGLSVVMRAFSMMFAVGLAVFDAVALFMSVQTKDGFDITAISKAPFTAMIIVTVIGAGISVICYFVSRLNNKDNNKNMLNN